MILMVLYVELLRKSEDVSSSKLVSSASTPMRFTTDGSAELSLRPSVSVILLRDMVKNLVTLELERGRCDRLMN